MISETVIQATPREEHGKNAARRVRAAGRIPAAVYGGGLEPVTVSVNAREIAKILRSDAGKNTIFTLAIDGHDSSPVMIKNMDVHPVDYAVLHTDFVRVNMREKTHVTIPLDFVGDPIGVRVGGGMLEAHTHSIEIECLPRDIPERLTIDVSNMEVDEQLTAGQIPIDSDSITILNPDQLIAVIHVQHGDRSAEGEDEGVEAGTEPAGTEPAS